MRRWSLIILLGLAGCTPWDTLLDNRLCGDGGLRPGCAADASVDDAGTDDAGTDDAGTDDAGTDDAGTDDAGTDDAGTDDAGTDDAGTDDAGTEDAGTDDAGMDGGVDAGPVFLCDSDAGGDIEWILPGTDGLWDLGTNSTGLFVLDDRLWLLPDGGAASYIRHFSFDGGLIDDLEIPLPVSATVILRFAADDHGIALVRNQSTTNEASLTLFDGGSSTVVPLGDGGSQSFFRVALKNDGAWVEGSSPNGTGVFDVTPARQLETVVGVTPGVSVVDLVTDSEDRAVVVVRGAQNELTRVVTLAQDAGPVTLTVDAGNMGGAGAGITTTLSRPYGAWLGVFDEREEHHVALGRRTPTSFTPVSTLGSPGRPIAQLATCEGSDDVFVAVTFGDSLTVGGMTIGDGGLEQLALLRLRSDGGVAWIRGVDLGGQFSVFAARFANGRFFVSANCRGDDDGGACSPNAIGRPFILSIKP